MNSITFEPGWNISQRGYNIISENDLIKDKKTLLQNALDADLKEIGVSVLSKELIKPTITKLVLQIQKIRNVSAPKANEDSSVAPRMLKLILTDGESYTQAIEKVNISTISREKTPPGSKILLSNVQVWNGFLILKPDNTKLLGGKVAHLYEKWELAKSVQHCSRPTAAIDGPPAWVNFGSKISAADDEYRFSDGKTKDPSRAGNSEFENLRQGAIAEATTGAVKKVFGGGIKQPISTNNRNDYNKVRNDGGRGNNKNRKENKNNRDKDMDEIPQKPSDKVSLFDFLEDKLNITETSTNIAKQKQGNGEYFPYNSTKPTVYSKKNYNGENFNSIQKNSNQKREYGSYNETKYNPQKDSSVNYGYPKYSKETNKVQESYNSSRYVPKEGSYKSLPTNRSNHSQDYPNNRRESNKPLENSYPNRYNNSRDLEDSIKANKGINFKQDHSLGHNDKIRDSNIVSRNRKEELNDNWHYRAPERTQNTNSSIDQLAESLTKVSMNSEFASRSLRQHLNLDMKKQLPPPPVQDTTPKNEILDSKIWNIGDECLAKYWEDEKFYPAKITAATETTYVVQFKGYGNVEEVLKVDCMPHKSQSRVEDKRHYKSSTLEFRRNPRKSPYS